MFIWNPKATGLRRTRGDSSEKSPNSVDEPENLTYRKSNRRDVGIDIGIFKKSLIFRLLYILHISNPRSDWCAFAIFTGILTQVWQSADTINSTGNFICLRNDFYFHLKQLIKTRPFFNAATLDTDRLMLQCNNLSYQLSSFALICCCSVLWFFYLFIIYWCKFA